MMESINGLHSCKPGNDPVVGQIKTFTIEHRPAQNGKKAWIKIKSVPAEMGGIPHRILSAEPTGYTDKFNNVSYNLEVEALSGDGTCAGRQKSSRETSEPHTGAETQAAHITAQQAETRKPLSKDDYWERKLKYEMSVQPKIIRQHSQSMALEVLKLKVTLNELTVEDLTPAKLRTLADYFDNDVIGAAQ